MTTGVSLGGLREVHRYAAMPKQPAASTPQKPPTNTLPASRAHFPNTSPHPDHRAVPTPFLTSSDDNCRLDAGAAVGVGAGVESSSRRLQ